MSRKFILLIITIVVISWPVFSFTQSQMCGVANENQTH